MYVYAPEEITGSPSSYVEKSVVKTHRQKMDETREKPWKKYFQNSVSDYQGCVGTLQDAECLIRSFEFDTTTTFAVYKSKSKGFGSTGDDIFFVRILLKKFFH